MMTAVRECTSRGAWSRLNDLQAFADARAAAPSRGEKVQALLRSPRVGIAQRLADAGQARVEDEAVHVGELAAQRARETQVEEAVPAHRAADVQQQDEARSHAAAVLPREPERRAAAPNAAPYRALQVETAAVRGARFAPQLQVLQPAREATHQRLDPADILRGVEIAEIRGRERFLAARAMALGMLVVVAGTLPSRLPPAAMLARVARRVPWSRRPRVGAHDLA